MKYKREQKIKPSSPKIPTENYSPTLSYGNSNIPDTKFKVEDINTEQSFKVDRFPNHSVGTQSHYIYSSFQTSSPYISQHFESNILYPHQYRFPQISNMYSNSYDYAGYISQQNNANYYPAFSYRMQENESRLSATDSFSDRDLTDNGINISIGTPVIDSWLDNHCISRNISPNNVTYL